jgi:truncated hemoglobin YjbI
MESHILPNDVMNEVFDIVKKQEKLYIIFKEDTEESEDKVRKILGDEVEFVDLFELLHNKLLKDFSNSISIFDNEPLVEKLGFREFTEIFYDLSRLDQSRKMLFNYALLGRRGSDGMLQKLGGKRLGTGVVVLPSENEKEAESFIKKWNVGFSKRTVLLFEEG